MRIAITGASGFIGKELLKALNKKGYTDVVALTRKDVSSFDEYNCEWMLTDYSFESLKAVLEGVNTVVHLAGVRGNADDPEVFAPNLEMTENILKAMNSVKANRIIFASSVAVYSGNDPMPWTEDSSLRGYTAYGDSKADCEAAIMNAADSYGLSYTILRIAQVLGDGETRRGMMNAFLDAAREHRPLTVMGKSVIKRQYIYIKDLINILSYLATDYDADVAKGTDRDNIILNVGMEHVYTNLEIAQMVNEVFGNPAKINYEDSYKERLRGFHMDTRHLREELGYEPMDMKEALEDVEQEFSMQS